MPAALVESIFLCFSFISSQNHPTCIVLSFPVLLVLGKPNTEAHSILSIPHPYSAVQAAVAFVAGRVSVSLKFPNLYFHLKTHRIVCTLKVTRNTSHRLATRFCFVFAAATERFCRKIKTPARNRNRKGRGTSKERNTFSHSVAKANKTLKMSPWRIVAKNTPNLSHPNAQSERKGNTHTCIHKGREKNTTIHILTQTNG